MGVHFARTRLLALENTFNGRILPASYIQEATAFARGKGLGVHLDGARIYNAAVAQGISLAQACEDFDSVSICFSKGLGAPVGSVLTGSRAFIERAHRWRKVLGGGMRQSGFLAAACLYALDHHVDRLAEDHLNAERLARGLADIPEVTLKGQATNMVFARFPQQHCAPLQAFLTGRGILTDVMYESRFVTHLDITTADIDAFVGAVKQYFTA